jgi:hypothetical protein
VLDRVAKGKGGLIVQRGEFSAELTIEAEQRTGFDRAKCFGESIVAVWVCAGAEVSFHRPKVEFLAAGLEVQLFCLGAVADEEVGDIVALACAGEVERLGELGLGPAASAKEFFDHGVEAGVNGFMEQREVFSGAFRHSTALTGFERILKREELASLDDIQELLKVLRQGSVANGHLPRMLRAAAWTWQGGMRGGQSVRDSFQDPMPWTYVCGPEQGLTWHDVASSNQKAHSLPPLTERYGISAEAAALVKWFTTLRPKDWLGNLTPSLEENLKQQIGISAEWSEKNLPLYFSMLA